MWSNDNSFLWLGSTTITRLCNLGFVFKTCRERHIPNSTGDYFLILWSGEGLHTWVSAYMLVVLKADAAAAACLNSESPLFHFILCLNVSEDTKCIILIPLSNYLFTLHPKHQSSSHKNVWRNRNPSWRNRTWCVCCCPHSPLSLFEVNMISFQLSVQQFNIDKVFLSLIVFFIYLFLHIHSAVLHYNAL